MTCLLLVIIIGNAVNSGLLLLTIAFINKYRQEIKTMGTQQEATLDQGIQTLKDAIAAANQRVIDKLNELAANNPDLTDEIQSVTEAVEAANAILREETPGGDGGTGGGESETGTSTAGGELGNSETPTEGAEQETPPAGGDG